MATSTSISTSRANLLNFNRDDMSAWLSVLGEKVSHAGRLLQWVHQRGVTDFASMVNLSQRLQQRLQSCAEIRLPKIVLEQTSIDGTLKWLLQLDDGNRIETVFIPESGRGTLCVSSQVGCALNCDFCATAKQGFNRNLSVAEIIGQLWLTQQRLLLLGDNRQHVITNVVMMGMGEPLLNFSNVVKAMDLMLDDYAYNLSKYRVTLSTSGIVPAIKRLQRRSPVALAVSLHAPNDALRDKLVPINRKFPLSELLAVCKAYFRHEPKRTIVFEYVMLAGVNDSREHAHALVVKLAGIRAKINLIPFNSFANTGYKSSSEASIATFKSILVAAGILVTVRKKRGDDIDGACGQLVGMVKPRCNSRRRKNAT